MAMKIATTSILISLVLAKTNAQAVSSFNGNQAGSGSFNNNANKISSGCSTGTCYPWSSFGGGGMSGGGFGGRYPGGGGLPFGGGGGLPFGGGGGLPFGGGGRLPFGGGGPNPCNVCGYAPYIGSFAAKGP